MKIAVRALVLAMLITGFAADHMLASKSTGTPNATMMASNSACPIPSCEPGKTCGFNK
jgi:hypothetical protein